MKVIFMGTPEFSVPVLEALIENYEVIMVVTQPDKKGKRGSELLPSPVKQVALKHQIPVFQPEKIRKDCSPIMELNPDFLITAAYGQMIPQKILDLPKYKPINVHASLLPKYRGGAPIHRAVYNGDEYIGVSIMNMAAGMDSGYVLAQGKFKLEDSDKLGNVREKLAIMGRDLLINVMKKVEQGTIEPVRQDESLVTFAYNIKKEEELIDFNRTSREVFNHIRAFNPDPIAYFMLDGEAIKVFDSYIVQDYTDAVPGEIIKVNKHDFYIKTKDGAIAILELQYPGKKRMKAQDFINGIGKNLLSIGKKVNI